MLFNIQTIRTRSGLSTAILGAKDGNKPQIVLFGDSYASEQQPVDDFFNYFLRYLLDLDNVDVGRELHLIPFTSDPAANHRIIRALWGWDKVVVSQSIDGKSNLAALGVIIPSEDSDVTPEGVTARLEELVTSLISQREKEFSPGSPERKRLNY